MTISAIPILKSKTRSSILETFFKDPEKEYYMRQLEEMTGYSVGNIRREMIRLQSDGIFHVRNIGNMKLYKLNKSYPLYDEIKNIVRKTLGIEGSMKQLLGRFKEVEYAFIYGSYAESKERSLSDVDVIVIGDVIPRAIKAAFYEYQAKAGREIDSIVYTRSEFLRKIAEKNHFVSSVVKAKKIFIKGDDGEFRRFVQVRKARKT
jgi:predicted nucleotidyltransferase